MTGRLEELHGRISGAVPITVVLGHGFGTDQSAWDGVRPWLDQRFRVLSYDLAGAGPNGETGFDPRRHGTLFGYADDLVQIIDEQAIDGAIYLAHSVSCMIGAAAALARPSAFARLVMVGASPRYLNDDGYHGGFEQGDLDGLYDAMSANFQAWAAGFVPLVVGVPDNAAVDAFSRMLFQMRPDIAMNLSRTIFQSDMREIVRRLERPVHLLQTRRDLAVPEAVARWLAANIDRASLDIIDAEGHVPHMTAPAEVVRVLEHCLVGRADS